MRPFVMVLVAVLAAMSLAVAPGCGGDEVESVVSDITQGETGKTGGAAEDVDDPGNTAPEATAPEASVGTGATESGGSDAAGGGDTSGATTLEIPADEGDLAFAKEEAEAPAGQVTLRMPNPSPIPHNIAVDRPEKTVGEVVTEGGVSEITVRFPAGEYEYYCSVPGHREAGMVGTLTVG